MKKVIKELIAIFIVVVVAEVAFVYSDPVETTSRTPIQHPRPQWWFHSPYTYIHGTSSGDFLIKWLKVYRNSIGTDRLMTWAKVETNLLRCNAQLAGFSTYMETQGVYFILWKFDPTNPPIYWDIVSMYSSSSTDIEWDIVFNDVWFDQYHMNLHFDGPGIYKITVYYKFRVLGDVWGCWHRGQTGFPFIVETNFESNVITLGNVNTPKLIHTPVTGNPLGLPSPKLYPTERPIS